MSSQTPAFSVASRAYPQLKSVLVATDLSEASHRPLYHALRIARHYRAKVYLVHVVSRRIHNLTRGHASKEAETNMQELGHDLLQIGALDGMDHEFLVREGVVWEELQLIVAQERIDLLALGTHARHGLAKLLLGSVAEQIFRHANCLVLTVGPNSDPLEFEGTRPKFLLATDFGEGSLRALPPAISFADHFGGQLILLHVIRTAPIPEIPPPDVLTMRDGTRMASLQQLRGLMTAEQELRLEPEYMIRFGLPSEEILRVALLLKPDIIFLGLNPSSMIPITSHMPWATAYEVVCGARCPVLTVRS